MSTSSKYDKSVQRATGATPTHAEDAVGVTPVVHGAGAKAMLRTVTEADIGGFMNDPELEFAPQALALEEGQMVEGVLEGSGPLAEVTDPTTKEMREVPTWVIRSYDGNARVSLLTSAQLEKKLPPFVGDKVRIIRGKDLKTGSGRRVTDYLVCGPKRKDGAQRTFSDPSPRKALPAPIDTTGVDATGAPTNHAAANPEQHA